ncbi:MAG: hypothetical protein RH949_32385 [Coleofasciculus sp. A1-SPW-01]|uniref:hypothetical protein n=1 Tax=Coleofasciculus sp. A1-SPW-01 TaxID=3070819 RepID=UPI0032F23319
MTPLVSLKQQLLREIEALPEEQLQDVWQFVRFLVYCQNHYPYSDQSDVEPENQENLPRVKLSCVQLESEVVSMGRTTLNNEARKTTENPWSKFAGVFKDDPDFAEIAENIRSERNPIDGSGCLQLL